MQFGPVVKGYWLLRRTESWLRGFACHRPLREVNLQPLPALAMEGRALTNLLVLSLASLCSIGCLGNSDGPGEISDEGRTEGVFLGMDYIECMEHEDMERCWNVYLPTTINVSLEVPLVIDLHGNTLTMQDQRDLSEFDDLADENGFIAVWPQGHDNSWNSGYCCSTAGILG